MKSKIESCESGTFSVWVNGRAIYIYIACVFVCAYTCILRIQILINIDLRTHHCFVAAHVPNQALIILHIRNTSWWFQPIWKILYSQIGNLPQIGVKRINIWKHHLEYNIPMKCDAESVKVSGKSTRTTNTETNIRITKAAVRTSSKPVEFLVCGG